MDHIAILLKHVDLLDRLDGLHIQLLERRLQLFVIGTRCLVYLLRLPPRRALAPAPVSLPTLPPCASRINHIRTLSLLV